MRGRSSSHRRPRALREHGDGVDLDEEVGLARFTRLAGLLGAVERTRDPVHDLMALGAGYHANALAVPVLYRTMFDAAAELEDPDAAARTFSVLVDAVARAREAGRFSPGCDPHAVATQFWVTSHGLAMLVLTGVLPREALEVHAPDLAIALFLAAGDDEDACRRSVALGWSSPHGAGP